MSNYVHSVFERNTQFVCMWTWGQGEEKWTNKCWTLRYYKVVLQSCVPAAQHYFQIFLWEWPGSVQQSRHHWCSPWCPPPHQPSERVGSGLKREKVQVIGEYTSSSGTLWCIKLLTKVWNSKGISCYLCRGSRRGRVHPDLLWWSRHAQTGWHWDPRTHGQNITPPSDREEHRMNSHTTLKVLIVIKAQLPVKYITG